MSVVSRCQLKCLVKKWWWFLIVFEDTVPLLANKNKEPWYSSSTVENETTGSKVTCYRLGFLLDLEKKMYKLEPIVTSIVFSPLGINIIIKPSISSLGLNLILIRIHWLRFVCLCHGCIDSICIYCIALLCNLKYAHMCADTCTSKFLVHLILINILSDTATGSQSPSTEPLRPLTCTSKTTQYKGEHDSQQTNDVRMVLNNKSIHSLYIVITWCLWRFYNNM